MKGQYLKDFTESRSLKHECNQKNFPATQILGYVMSCVLSGLSKWAAQEAKLELSPHCKRQHVL